MYANARTRMQAYAYKHKSPNVSVPLSLFFFLKTTLTLLLSPLLHAERPALQAPFYLVPTERPYSTSLAPCVELVLPNQSKPQLLCTSSYWACVVHKTRLVLLYRARKKRERVGRGGGDVLQPLISSQYDSREENWAKGSCLMSRQAQFIPPIGLSPVMILMEINDSTLVSEMPKRQNISNRPRRCCYPVLPNLVLKIARGFRLLLRMLSNGTSWWWPAMLIFFVVCLRHNLKLGHSRFLANLFQLFLIVIQVCTAA
jgi:hypothetical protein